jgi:hypothetical protein
MPGYAKDRRELSIIEDLLIGYRLPVFTKRAKRAMTAQPKFYFFDAGVYYHLRPRGRNTGWH